MIQSSLKHRGLRYGDGRLPTQVRARRSDFAADRHGRLRRDASVREPRDTAVQGVQRAVRVLDRGAGVDLRDLRVGAHPVAADLRADFRPSRPSARDHSGVGRGDRGVDPLRSRGRRGMVVCRPRDAGPCAGHDQRRRDGRAVRARARPRCASSRVAGDPGPVWWQRRRPVGGRHAGAVGARPAHASLCRWDCPVRHGDDRAARRARDRPGRRERLADPAAQRPARDSRRFRARGADRRRRVGGRRRAPSCPSSRPTPRTS